MAIASHAVRETARDALFLGGLPAERLPYAYLLIAAGAIVVGIANRYLLDHFSHRRLLVASMIGASAIDALFWTVTDRPSAEVLFGLYAWTGLLGTAITMQLWLHLASVFDVEESKRAFPLVTAGGLTGAVLGSAFAGGILLAFDTNALLLASGGLQNCLV
jgi:AAA family ATP:ADP antiporter